MTTQALDRWLIALLAGIGFASAADVDAVDTRCLADGGDALCTEPVVAPSTPSAAVDDEMWTYNVCDVNAATQARNAAWCTALGGCGQPVFDAGIAPVAKVFEKIVNDACVVNVTDSGWGQTLPPNLFCWSGPPLVRNGQFIRDFRILNLDGTKTPGSFCIHSWADVVYAGRWRSLACPATYGTRTKANGDLECWKLAPECSAKVGNPINLLDGCKVQREVDYRSRTPGGVEVQRYYNSAGFFRFDAAPEKSTDVWRTTWDRRLLAAPAGSNLLAYAQRPDGALQVFLPNGRELHNNQGGAAALLERLVDAAGATTGWRLTSADTDIEVYDAAGRVQSITLRAGQAYALAYDASGRLGTVTDAYGGVLTFTYDAAGRLSGFVAPGNRIYVYGYDAKGRLTSVTYPDGAVRSYHYENADFLHALTGITDENGQRFATWDYDSMGRAISSRHAGGAEAVTLYHGSFSTTANEGMTSVVDAFATTRSYYYQVAGGVLRVKRVTQPCPGCTGANASYTYDANGNIATYRDFNGNQTNYAYDLTRNLEISRTEAYGTALARTITTQWHPTHRLPTRITAPSGVAGVDQVTDFVYDARGNVLQKTITAGGRTRQWKSTYSALGQLLTVDGPRTDVTDVTTYTYFASSDPCGACRGNVKSVANALGHVTTFDAYDADGQPKRITDPNGVVTTYAYDLRGRLRARTVDAGNPAAETTAFDYDSAGQLVKVTLPDGSFLRYQYDTAHRLTEVVDSLGNVIQYTLDAMGNRTKEDVFDPADRLARTQQRIYDALNRLHNDIGAAGQTSTYAYDGNGNLKSVADPLNRSTTLAYDALNRLMTSTDPAGGVTQYGYDARDRLVAVKDPINLTTTYAYDGLGNLTQFASPDTGISTYVPDAAGNVVGATDARGMATSHTYDALNRQTLTTFVGGSVTLEYDNTATGGAYARGRLTRIIDPSGSTTYAYDAHGRVLSKRQTVGVDASAKSFTVGYQYAAGRMTGITYPSGRSVSYAFDSQGRISGMTMAGQTVLTGAAYFPFGRVQGWTWGNGQKYQRSYDLDGRIATLTTGPDTATFAKGDSAFGYDSLNRLTTATLSWGDTLAYTYDANGNRRQETRGTTVTSYGYGAASNRLQALSGAQTRSYAYDASGNLTNNGTVTMTYDGRGRLTQLSSGHRYAINGAGQRVAKSGSGVATGTLYFVYDEQGRLIGEYDATGAVQQELIYLADTPVASVRSAAGGGVDIYPIYADHLDTPRVIVNQANRKVWQWLTDTFGTRAANEDPNSTGTLFAFKLRFPGQYFDTETGLHYNYFRDYDPGVGRYVESDPIGLLGGPNTYWYAKDSPVSISDRLGLMGSRGNTHAFDGCGPNGQLLEWFIPDNWIFRFGTCCDKHDKCYDDCNGSPSKETCDTNFCECLLSVCMRYARGQKSHCDALGGSYCQAVRKHADGAFKNSRKPCSAACK